MQISSGFVAARVSATLKGGGDPVGRQQGNLRLDADNRVGVEGEAIPPPNGGENDRCFHKGKTALLSIRSVAGTSAKKERHSFV